jgi:hypothetical protein
MGETGAADRTSLPPTEAGDDVLFIVTHKIDGEQSPDVHDHWMTPTPTITIVAGSITTTSQPASQPARQAAAGERMKPLVFARSIANHRDMQAAKAALRVRDRI